MYMISCRIVFFQCLQWEVVIAWFFIDIKIFFSCEFQFWFNTCFVFLWLVFVMFVIFFLFFLFWMFFWLFCCLWFISIWTNFFFGPGWTFTRIYLKTWIHQPILICFCWIENIFVISYFFSSSICFVEKEWENKKKTLVKSTCLWCVGDGFFILRSTCNICISWKQRHIFICESFFFFNSIDQHTNKIRLLFEMVVSVALWRFFALTVRYIVIGWRAHYLRLNAIYCSRSLMIFWLNVLTFQYCMNTVQMHVYTDIWLFDLFVVINWLEF